MLSMRLARICWVMADGWLSFSLKTDSMTDSSVEVVSCPVKAHQSFTTMPKRDDVNIGLGTICWEQYWGAVLLVCIRIPLDQELFPGSGLFVSDPDPGKN